MGFWKIEVSGMLRLSGDMDLLNIEYQPPAFRNSFTYRWDGIT
jgi:hypothetical protein